MDIESFFTVQTTLPGAQKAGLGKGASGVQIQGLGFIDLILTRLLETGQTKPVPLPPKEGGVVTSDHPLLDQTAELDLTQFLTPGSEDALKDFITTPTATLTPEQQLAQIISLNQKALDDALSPLTDGIITSENVQNGSPRILHALLIDTEKDRKGVLNTLSLILNKLQKLSQDTTGVGLALTNLTPEQITQLKAKLEALLAKGTPVTDSNGIPVPVDETDQDSKDDDKDIADIVLGLIKLLPPQAQPEVIVMPRGLIITPRPLDIATNAGQDPSKPANDLAAKLNDLVTGSAPVPDAITGKPASDQDNFDELLKQFAGKKDDGTDLQLIKDGPKLLNTPAVKADLSTLLNWTQLADGTLQTAPSSWTTDGLLPANLTITGPSTLTNPVTQAPMASVPLPAVQMVAAVIQKAVTDGQDKNFTIQLEPPDLGHVEVRLSFARDKTVKAVVFAEHSETVAMLQRDAHFLERALQNAGVDPNGSLSFELAGDGYFNDGGHDGSGGGGAKGGDGQDAEAIDTTMTWYVDPSTGYTHYDILA